MFFTQNLLLWAVTILTSFSLILLSFKLFGLKGLYVFSGFALIIANIQIAKSVDIVGMQAQLGLILFAATFLTTDIINELYGKKEAKTAVYIGFFGMMSFLILTQLGLWFEPNALDTGHEPMQQLFALLPRITAGSLAAYLLSNLYDVWIFAKVREWFPKHIWVRNNASTITSQLLDSTLFGIFGFAGAVPPEVLMQIIFSAYVFKIAAAVVDTPFVYFAKWLAQNTKIGILLPSLEKTNTN